MPHRGLQSSAACVASVAVLFFSDIPMSIIALDMCKVMDMFPLLAVVGFIFAGALMEKGGMARQIVDMAQIFVGRIQGGLGITTILGCLFFAAMIGSGPGTVAAMGSIMIPTMVRRGYSPEYAAGVCATGGTLGILIPPSNPMIIYGIIASTLHFQALHRRLRARLPSGLLHDGHGLRSGQTRRLPRHHCHRRRTQVLAAASQELLLPHGAGHHSRRHLRGHLHSRGSLGHRHLLLSLFVGLFITRELKLAEIWDAIKMTNASAGSIIIVLGVSTLFGRILTMQRIPHLLANWMITLTDNPYVILILIGLLLLFLGMFMETLATIVILAPIFLPLVLRVGIDPVFFGIFWVVTNEVALLSPPLGVNLFIAQKLSGITFERVAKGAFPYMLLIIAFIILLIIFQDIPLILPRLLGM